jgi:hypothetical protein
LLSVFQGVGWGLDFRNTVGCRRPCSCIRLASEQRELCEICMGLQFSGYAPERASKSNRGRSTRHSLCGGIEQVSQSDPPSKRLRAISGNIWPAGFAAELVEAAFWALHAVAGCRPKPARGCCLFSRQFPCLAGKLPPCATWLERNCTKLAAIN